ncbi:fimbria/pilus outer membrane usher protein [Sphingobium algorifonticola]|nr:fimbria/pilus outer membrane usher protein [Sphingobium algorifonticola]
MRCSRLPRPNRPRSGFAGLLACALLVPGAARAQNEGAGLRALLLRVNDVEAVEPVRVTVDGAAIWADADALRQAGVTVSAGRKGPVDLATLPDTTAVIDDASQRLDIRQRRSNRLSLTRSVHAEAMALQPLSPARAAIALSYDLTAVVGADDRPTLSGYVETRMFAGGAQLAYGLLLAPGRTGGTRPIRLDSALVLTDPARLFRATVGDFIGTGLRWSRSVRVAGIQIGNDFALRPDLVTYPLPSIAGDVAVASTIDVIAQGGRSVAQAQVEPGDYLLSGIPVPTGHGTLGIVVRDASGRQSLRTIDLYGAPQLLAPGLMEIGGDMGAVRAGYGRRDADYRGFAASVTVRRGITPWLTVEGHGETTEALRLGGVGAITALGSFGVLSLDAAVSQVKGAAAEGTGAGGHQIGIAFERVARPFSFSLAARHVSRGHRDTASVNGDAPPRSTLSAQVGMDMGPLGSASIGYTRLASVTNGSFRLDRLSLLTASYSVHLGEGINLFAAGLGDFGRTEAHSLSLAVTMALGGARMLTAGYDMRAGMDSAIADYRNPALFVGDLGYRLAMARGAAARLLAEVDYRAMPARLSLGVDRIAGRTSARLAARGALLLIDDGIFFADSLAGGFAIVSAGAPDVTILQDHRPVGRTGRDGRALVTNLRLYQDNLLAIDPLDLPPDARAGATRMIVRPGERGPVMARFAVDRRAAASAYLIDAAGVPVSAGSTAQLNGGEEMPVGYGGLVWLDGLLAENDIRVTDTAGGNCVATVHLTAQQMADFAQAPRLGNLQCLPL